MKLCSSRCSASSDLALPTRVPKLTPLNHTQVPKVTYEEVEMPYEESVDSNCYSTSKLSTASTERAASPSKSRIGGLFSWFTGSLSPESEKKDVVVQSGLNDQNPSPPKYQTSIYPASSYVTSKPKSNFTSSSAAGYFTPVRYATTGATHSYALGGTPARTLTYSAQGFEGASSAPQTTYGSTVNHGQALSSLLAQ